MNNEHEMKQVYYSKAKSSLWFINEREGRLRISGAGCLCKDDIEVHNPDKNWCGAFRHIEISDSVTEIGPGFLENFRNMRCLVLPKALTAIGMTDDLRSLLDQNKPVIHAAYGSFGAEFAEQNGLKLRPANILLGWRRDEKYDESYSLTLRFLEDGTMDVLYDHITSGVSAGSNGGASKSEKLPEGYRPGCSVEEFAGLFPSVYYEQIVRNPEVKVFLERQKQTGHP